MVMEMVVNKDFIFVIDTDAMWPVFLSDPNHAFHSQISIDSWC